MEEILRTLVGFKSVSGNLEDSKRAMDYAADFVSRRGMHARRFEDAGFPSLVATTQPDDLAPTVLLVAHLDVVPGSDGMFDLRVSDGKYQGRGVYDMKGGLAAFLQLIDTLPDISRYNFGLMVTADEEIGGVHGAKYLVAQGYRPRVCIIPDAGDNWQFETFEKGVQWIKLEAAGQSAHASRPWEGEHAVHKLLGALSDIREVLPTHDNKKGTILSVGTIKGGETANQIADFAEAMLDIRTGSRADHLQTIPAIKRICKVHDVKPTVLVDDLPCVNDINDPYIAAFRKLVIEQTGAAGDTKYSYAVTDGRFFSAVGVPCVITMPPGGGWHGQDEWASIEGLDQYVQVLGDYLAIVS